MELVRSNKQLIVTLLIIFFGLIIFYPSFNIHFDGDSLLTLYRFQHIVGEGREFNYFNYFFTDYGPQDSVFAIIYHFYGLNPTPYFVASFIMRIIAAFSFLPLVLFLFKDKILAYLASIFFLVTSTGLETTGWVFNMPSYIAITLFNLYLLSVFKSKEKDSLKLIFISVILFGLTIVVQPIRMAFLPLLGIFIEVLYLLFRFKKVETKYSFIRISIYILIVLSIFLFGKIGGSIGIGSTENRLSGGFINSIFKYFSDFKPENGKYEFKFFLFPIAQLGQMVFPNRLVLRSWESLNPITTSELLSFFAGGYLLILIMVVLLSTLKNKSSFFRSIVILSIIGFGYFIFWLRNPSVITATQERYLIVSSVGITLLLSAFVANAKNKFPLYLFFILAILIHALGSFKYLNHLSDVRGVRLTENIRNSIPDVFDKHGNTPILFYFQPSNSEILHHSLMFGFPVIVYFQYGIDYPWSLVYTPDWQEVVSAYTDGEATKNYTSKVEVVVLDNIYSFDLEGDALVDTTEITRQKLMTSSSP